MQYWEIIADNLKKAGWSLGWVSVVDSQGRMPRSHHSSQEFSNGTPFWLSKRLAEVAITIRMNGSILGPSSNRTKKVSSK